MGGGGGGGGGGVDEGLARRPQGPRDVTSSPPPPPGAQHRQYVPRRLAPHHHRPPHHPHPPLAPRRNPQRTIRIPRASPPPCGAIRERGSPANTPQDEHFHIPQAQAYCAARFAVWDPQITTPPGLYLLSAGLLGPWAACSPAGLRALNAAALALLPALLARILRARGARGAARWHAAANIALFPVLFFFSALYYTDVLSTASVLLSHAHFLHQPSNHLTTFLLGLLSLSLRQTNIFWVAVYPLTLECLRLIDRGPPAARASMQRRVPGFGASARDVVRGAFRLRVVYDVPVREACVAGARAPPPPPPGHPIRG